MNDSKLEQLEIATLLSRGSCLARDIKQAWIKEDDDMGVDQEDAVALADTFLRLKHLLITTREDREALESTEAV